MTMTAIAANQPTASYLSTQTTADEETAPLADLASNPHHKASISRGHAPSRVSVPPGNRTWISSTPQKPTLVADGRQLTSFDRRHPCMTHQLGRRHISPKEPTRVKAHLLPGSAQPATGPSASDASEPPLDTDEGIDGDE
ncbi:hypothetical protein ACQPW1_01915 [Nocardia sp. CA-128927]|uniref:hypothetical protein n=1 Tax=Nocardia sp. CA-128927 TaxID=3239975 RepID=UPI003D95368B